MDRRRKSIKELSVSIIQMLVEKNKKNNLKKAKKLIEKSLKDKPDIIILPEMFNCPYDISYFSDFSEKEEGETWTFLSQIAKKNDTYIIGGSIPEKHNHKIYNTSYIFDKQGKQIGKYRKTHLFDIDVENGQYFCESDVLSPGNYTEIVSIEGIDVGILICYDIRFPEISRKLAINGAKLIVVPAAFNMTTGPLHWELLFRARALDNQIFLIAVSQARNYSSNYISYGNSLICDPWGKVIQRLSEKEGILSCKINLSEINKVRNQIPVLKHLRTNLY